MARIRTQEDFVQKATEIHNGKYDYSAVEYVKSNSKVKIICPVHGMFEQTPNSHLVGKGCRQCGRDATKMGFDEFVRRAREIHGDKYDYSNVIYYRIDQKVTIVCPVHGKFEQTPHSHLILKQNCPKCANISGGLKRMGDNNCMRNDNVKHKSRMTCEQRYGAKTYAESNEGRKKLHDIITSDEVQFRTIQTCLYKYGTKTWTQSDAGREKLHQIMSSADMKQKVKNGYVNAYGVDHYMKTTAGREKARLDISQPERRMAIRNSFIVKYGATNAFSVPEIREKIKQTNLLRYGVKYVGLSSEIHQKAWQTKRRNGTTNTSMPEQTLYLMLCDVFGIEDVDKQYSDARYPFHCDFYVKSLDLFIELNAHWTHGGHWFNVNDPLDIEKVFLWSSYKLNSLYYQSAIHVWTERDLMKRQCAINNHLNYLVFWDSDLTDAKAWLSQFLL